MSDDDNRKIDVHEVARLMGAKVIGTVPEHLMHQIIRGGPVSMSEIRKAAEANPYNEFDEGQPCNCKYCGENVEPIPGADGVIIGKFQCPRMGRDICRFCGRDSGGNEHTVTATPLHDLMTQNKQMREALRFYAKREHWLSSSSGFQAQYDPEKSPVDRDHGKRARELVEVIDAKNAQYGGTDDATES